MTQDVASILSIRQSRCADYRGAIILLSTGNISQKGYKFVNRVSRRPRLGEAEDRPVQRTFSAGPENIDYLNQVNYNTRRWSGLSLSSLSDGLARGIRRDSAADATAPAGTRSRHRADPGPLDPHLGEYRKWKPGRLLGFRYRLRHDSPAQPPLLRLGLPRPVSPARWSQSPGDSGWTGRCQHRIRVH